jgi:acetoin utilization protein AcuB
MFVGDIMSRETVTALPDEDVEHIWTKLETHRIHHVLVMAAGRLVGVISDRDVLRATSPFIGHLSEQPRDVATLKKKAHQIMTRDVKVAMQDETANAAATRMLAHSISCLPVLSQDGRLEGILTWRDLLRALAG